MTQIGPSEPSVACDGVARLRVGVRWDAEFPLPDRVRDISRFPGGPARR